MTLSTVFVSERELKDIKKQRSQSLAQMKDFMVNLKELKKRLNIEDEEDDDPAKDPIPFSREWKRRSTEAAIRVRNKDIIPHVSNHENMVG